MQTEMAERSSRDPESTDRLIHLLFPPWDEISRAEQGARCAGYVTRARHVHWCRLSVSHIYNPRLIQFYLFSDSVEIKSNHQTINKVEANHQSTQYHMYALCIKRIQIPITIWVVPRVVCQ